MSSLNAPWVGASDSGSSRRHSIDTICHPASVRCWMTSGLNGPEITSRIRSKCAMVCQASVMFLLLMSARNSSARNRACAETPMCLRRLGIPAVLGADSSCRVSTCANHCSLPDAPFHRASADLKSSGAPKSMARLSVRTRPRCVIVPGTQLEGTLLTTEWPEGNRTFRL